MRYIFFSVIILTIFTAFINKKRNFFYISMFLILTALMIIYPQISLNAAKDGINLWIFIVLPSLLPFFIINDILISLKVPENLAKAFTPIASLIFHTSGYGAYVFIMSIFSGYPTGAKITAQLVESRKITSSEGQRILCFSSTSGPLFIIGVVGSSLLKSPAAGYLLILSHILGAVLNGIIFGVFKPMPKKHTVLNLGITNTNKLTFGEMFSNAILNSMITSGLIGGYIILFSVIIGLLNNIQFFSLLQIVLNKLFFIPQTLSYTISHLIEASLEISNGCKIIADLNMNTELKLIFLCFVISFSGLAVIGQVSGIISRTRIDIKKYIFTKISHGILSCAVCIMFMRLNTFHIMASSNSFNRASLLSQEIILIQLLLALLLVLNISACRIIRRNSRNGKAAPYN